MQRANSAWQIKLINWQDLKIAMLRFREGRSMPLWRFLKGR
jgi:hypothetical protein